MDFDRMNCWNFNLAQTHSEFIIVDICTICHIHLRLLTHFKCVQIRILVFESTKIGMTRKRNSKWKETEKETRIKYRMHCEIEPNSWSARQEKWTRLTKWAFTLSLIQSPSREKTHIIINYYIINWRNIIRHPVYYCWAELSAAM